MNRFSGLLWSNKLNQQWLVNRIRISCATLLDLFHKALLASLTLHCIKDLEELQKSETASLRSDHCSVCVNTHTHTHTHTHTQYCNTARGFFNFPLYFFININQISLLTAVVTMHLYKAIMLEFISLIVCTCWKLHVNV